MMQSSVFIPLVNSHPGSRESAPPSVPPRDLNYSILNTYYDSLHENSALASSQPRREQSLQNTSFPFSPFSHISQGKQSYQNASNSYLHSSYNYVNMAPHRRPLPTPPSVRDLQSGRVSAHHSPSSFHCNLGHLISQKTA